MDARARRIADNESRFRAINERLRTDLTVLPDDQEPVDFVCECGQVDCAEPVRLTLAEYEAVRASSLDFAVAPGHQIGDVEDVVDFNERYARVRKHPESAEVVRESDPRRD
ncbi:MAG: hypothetical protein M3320_07390 [Actinomycetota bacterium]|nr:hypothetical protein [Actinomycetota bacterium]MDQ5808485.1 hypothetical protein [Actinomycetota bacterium]